jgi:2'-5' RNA ligase
MKRLFIAIPLEQNVIDKIADYINPYKELPLLKNAKWVNKNNYHITTLFLGDISDRQLPEIKSFIRGVCSHVPKFTLNLDRVTFFPPTDNPHMIWLKFRRSLQFEELSAELFKYLYEVDFNLKKDPDEKEPIPHLTLARLRDSFPIKQIKWSQLDLPPVTATSCHLYESTLTPSGPLYTLLEEYPFQT